MIHLATWAVTSQDPEVLSFACFNIEQLYVEIVLLKGEVAYLEGVISEYADSQPPI